MALPRPQLLAIAGALLSLMSFMVMRSLGATSIEDFPLPVPAPQSAVKPASETPKPAPPRVEDVPPAVADALQDGKLVVLLFVEPGAAEDAATAKNFKAVAGIKGVAAFRADIAKVGDYAGIVANVGLTQAPAVVIVRPDLEAVPPIEGYVESQYLTQRVRDQLP